jgi:hypothetical protein
MNNGWDEIEDLRDIIQEFIDNMKSERYAVGYDDWKRAYQMFVDMLNDRINNKPEKMPIMIEADLPEGTMGFIDRNGNFVQAVFNVGVDDE